MPRPLQPLGAPIVFLQKMIDGAAGPEYNKANTGIGGTGFRGIAALHGGGLSMPDATLFAQYRAIMQNTAFLGLYRELLALLRAAAREISRQAGDTWRVSALHTGKLDVSYFTVVTPAAARRKAKYVVAFVHATMTFELWLSAANQKALAQLPPVDAELLPEDRVPVPAEWAPFVAARWALGHTELWQPEALAEQAANRIRSLDLCL